MPIDLVFLITCVAQQGFPVGVFLAASKEFRDDSNLTRAIVNRQFHSSGRTRLMHAAQKANLERVNFLIKNGASVNTAMKQNNMTALMMATAWGYTGVVSSLVEARADVNRSMKDGTSNISTLMIACVSGKVEIVRILLSAGASVNFMSSDGKTVLMHLCLNDSTRQYWYSWINIYKGHLEIAQLLLEAGVDIDAAITPNDWTALTWACHYGSTDMVKFLLNAGAKDPLGVSLAIAKVKNLQGHFTIGR
jgi:ankyrin repeat protein